MSAPTRGRGGTMNTRGASPSLRARGSSRGGATNAVRARGRGRGGSAGHTTINNAGGLLQKLRSGSIQQAPANGATKTPRGRGTTARGRIGSSSRPRAAKSKTVEIARSSASTPSPSTSSPAPPPSHRDFMAHMNERFQSLKPKRDAERKRAIQDGFLADPEKKTSLASAITPVGTCTDMCPPFERVERIVQNMVDRAEKVHNEATGRDMPAEERMVKRFRRSAAGYDEQLPSDIRTPETLRRTLNYLLNMVIGGGERLALVHKFVWDRTRGIRNDFSIQQVTKKEDVQIAVDCFERIARFHILSLHQLSNPDNLQESEHFDAHQEREQLNNTLLSLMYYYDDHRGSFPLPNEPEFRAYCILFELQALTPDLEDRMQGWPVELLTHPQIQTAFRLHATASNVIMDQGPLRPTAPFSAAQSNSGKFWTIMTSQEVSYIMACVAEINFGIIRFIALDALWRSSKSAPQGQQARNQDWTLAELQDYLAFDEEDEALDFCQAFDLAFKNNNSGEQCLDFSAVATSTLDRTSIPSQQTFSHGIVESKRHRRNLVAVINGVSAAAAIQQGLVVDSDLDDNHGESDDRSEDSHMDDQSMFIPEQSVDNKGRTAVSPGFNLNPQAISFSPSKISEKSVAQEPPRSIFAQTVGERPDLSISGPMSNHFVSSATSKISTASQTIGNAATARNTSFAQKQSDGKMGFGFTMPTSTSTFLGSDQPTSPQSTTRSSQEVKPFSSLLQDIEQKDRQPAWTDHHESHILGGLNIMQKQPFPTTKTSMVDQHPAQGVTRSIGEDQSSSAIQVSTSGAGQWQKDAKEAEMKPFSLVTPSASSGFHSPGQSGSPSFSFKHPPPLRQTPVEEPHTVQPGLVLEHPVKPPKEQLNIWEGNISKLTSTPVDASYSANDDQEPRTLRPSKTVEMGLTVAASAPTQASQSSSIFSSVGTDQSTTPHGTPKKSQISYFDITPAAEPNVVAQRRERDHDKDKSIRGPTDAKSSLSAQAKNIAHPALVASSQLSPPTKPKFSDTDRIQLVEITSRLILTQRQGLMEYFVSHHVSNLLQSLVKNYLQDQQDEIMSVLRARCLSRKFFTIWKEHVQRKILHRRAKQRRKLLAAAMQAEQDRKQRDEAELEAILAATKETKRLQEEQRRIVDKSQDQGMREADLGHEQSLIDQASQVAGRKRKPSSPNSQHHPGHGTVRNSAPLHKRSRTIGSVSEPPQSSRLSTMNRALRESATGFSASRLGWTRLNRSSSSADLSQPAPQRMDATKTDYFKLKAMGIDPDTPTVPDTARSWELKRKEALEAKETLLNRSRLRSSMSSMASPSRTSSPSINRSEPRSLSETQSTSLRPTDLSLGNNTSERASEEDSFLKQLREARQSLAQDTDWFKSQAAVLEKEIEEQEKSRGNLDSRPSSRLQSPRVSVNGLVKANGYDYYPSGNKAGAGLSRTEERIRRTGAHGLATRPIGNDYVSVAMSRQTASKLVNEPQDFTSGKSKKRTRGKFNSSPDDVRHTEYYELTTTSPVMKRVRNADSLAGARNRLPAIRIASNVFAALQNYDHEDDAQPDEEQLEEEIDDNNADGQEEEEVVARERDYDHSGMNGDTEDNDDDLFEEDEEEDDDDHDDGDDPEADDDEEEEAEEEEEEEEEEEGDDDDDDPIDRLGPFSRAQSGSSLGVQSGLGASADDALILSD